MQEYLRTVCGVIGATALALSVATPVDARSLGEEISDLVSTHPEILAREKAVGSARQDAKRAFGGFLPSIDVTADAGYEHINSPGARAANGGAPTIDQKTVFTVTATQNLFDGFAVSSEYARTNLTVAIAEHTLEGIRQSTIFDGIDAYINVLRQQRLIELARSNELTIKRQLELEDERVQRGAGIAVDVLQSKAQLNLAIEQRVNFEGELQNAISRYIQVFDRAPDVGTMIDPVPPIDILPPSLEDAVASATTENPAISSSQATIEVADKRRDEARSDYYPSVDFVATWNRETDNDATLGVRRDYSFIVQATWNLFDGFATAASVSQAAFDYRASQDNHNFVLRTVIEDTRRAWQDLITSRQRAEILENAVNIASEVFESRKRLREEGKETVSEVLDAETDVIDTQIQFTQVTYDRLLAVYRLMLALGRLDVASTAGPGAS